MSRRVAPRVRGWGRAGVAAVVGLTLLGAPSSAIAFCRSRTVSIDPSFNPSETGRCFEEGVPLFWRNACVGYSIDNRVSRKLAFEVVANVVARSFTRWTGASCAGESTASSRVSIDVRDVGPALCQKVETALDRPNVNVILFRDNEWKTADGAARSPDTIGLTTVKFNTETGEIFGADMELNTYHHTMSGGEPTANEYDLTSVVTHEAGHFLGIAHSEQQQAVMYATYDKGRSSARELFGDDVRGICSVYRPDGTRPVLGSKVTSGGACDPTPYGGLQRDCETEPESAGCATAPDPRAGAAASLLMAVAGLALARRRRA
ncbi:MAG: matrixin family metalloprotease [Myxococcales bacterium]|nr:matrixin family metalloprotease [Myxococcales bacterium]MBL0196643.1 matrixin family metalloprotease [Myxococcales bacterium]HQY63195.1 matrixin family metalloprotease [Polyangiaceae bacterium]